MLPVSLLFSVALAADDGFRDLLSQAKGALVAGEYKDARDLLVSAEEAAPGEESLLTTEELARLYFLRGVLYWRASPESAALEAWRQTLTIDPNYQPESELLGDQAERDTFLALGDEVRARGDVGLELPEDPGEATIYVDGRPVGEGDAVIPGSHFVQIKCEGGEWAGSWYTFGKPPSNYLSICDGGVYKTAKSTSSSASSASSSKASSSSKSSSSTAKVEKGEKKGKGGLIGAGVGLLAVGAVGGGATVWLADQAANAADAYEEKQEAAEDNPDLDEVADKYYDEAVLPRYMRTYAAGGASAAFLIGGGALIAVGVATGTDGPMFTPVPGGGVFTWSGRF